MLIKLLLKEKLAPSESKFFSLRGYIFQKLLLAWFFSCINKKCFLSRRQIPFGHIWTIYTPHIDHFTPPTYSFWAIRSMLISFFKVTSWFDTVFSIVTRWVNFRRKKTVAWTWTAIIRLQYLEVFSPQCTNFWLQNIYLQFLFMNFSRSKWKIVNITRNTYIWVNTNTY